MFRDKVYRVLFFVVVTLVSHTVAMDNLFLIENPFAAKKRDNVVLTLDFPIEHKNKNDFFIGQDTGYSFEGPIRRATKSLKKVSYSHVFEVNKQGAYECPYNCPDNYAHENGKSVIEHIKRRHNETFGIKTFEPDEADLSAYIPRKRTTGGKRIYDDICERNNRGNYICPYNNCKFATKSGKEVGKHIRVRHDADFDLQAFNCETTNLDAWIPYKKKYADICKKNEKGEFECPFNCPDAYANKNVKVVSQHIRARHDKDFDVQAFDPETTDLNIYIARKAETDASRRYKDICKKNEKEEFVCPYNNCNYAKKIGRQIGQHIRARHDKTFKLRTFDSQKADLDVYIPRKKESGGKKYVEVFEKNKKEEFICPYFCPDEYTHKSGLALCKHIKTRHDPDFNLQLFNPDTDDLSMWTPRKRKRGHKRKRLENIKKIGRLRKRRKVAI